MSEAAKRTPLYEDHKKLGAKLIPFGGWDMPVSYVSVLEEHKTVREEAGVFDVSHMGEIFVEGPSSLDFIQKITINDASKLGVGMGQYTAFLNPKGGIIDDLIAYRLEDEKYLLCVNASNVDKDFHWVSENAAAFEGVTVSNQSDNWGQLALQGPKSFDALTELLSDEDRQKANDLAYTHVTEVTLEGTTCLLARTGYTGEKGCEIYIPSERTSKVFNALLTKPNTPVKPIGLGARDTLRLEACYNLYGNEMNDEISPLEAGIGWATKIDAKDFIGKDIVSKQKEEGAKRFIYAFILEDKGVPRGGMDVYLGEKKLGSVTSGSVLPTVGGTGGMALLEKGSVKAGDKVEIDVRGRRKLAKIVKRPLYSAKVKN